MRILGEMVFGICVQVALHSVLSRHGFGQECDRLLESLIGLRATESQKALARGAEAFPAQARHTAPIIRAFEQVHRQAMGLDAEVMAKR
jgi:hypothetical protein